jgi:hypothetical protein
MRVIIMTLMGSENYLQLELQRKNTDSLQFYCWGVARPAGFEPATYRLEGGCSNPLSYGRKPNGRGDNNTDHRRVFDRTLAPGHSRSSRLFRLV